MANVRDSDTSLWLHNKLGASNDLWSGSSICSQLNREVLRNIRECFNVLQSQVKLKLLLAFLHVPRRNVEEWKVELEEILEIALEDSDQWVSMVAELLKKYPMNGTINFDIQENSTVFTDLVSELKKLVKKHSDKSILPLESLYLNKSAFTAQVGHVTQPPKHFTLKRRPKSAALRVDLLQRSTDAASNVRRNSTGSSVPIRCRGVSKEFNDAPIRPIPRQNSLQAFKTPNANRNKVATRPSIGSKRDGGIKLLDITEQPIGREAKRKKKNPEEEKDKAKEDAAAAAEQEQTPDYAAGLSMIPPSPAPAYSVPATSQASVHSNETITKPPKPDINVLRQESARSAGDSTASQNVSTPPVHQTIQPQQFVINQPPVQQQILINPSPQQQQQGQGEKRQLSLSKEEMAEALEMFSNSNKVTRPEKALILGFMAGSRENPCPHLGNVVTIKLSENEESITKSDGTIQNILVETHYQMNYSTGEGKRIKKYHRYDPLHETQTQHPNAPQSHQQTAHSA